MHLQHDIIFQAGVVHLSFKTTVDYIKWSDSRRVDCILRRCMRHMMLFLQAGITHLSFKTKVGDIPGSNSKRVQGGLFRK